MRSLEPLEGWIRRGRLRRFSVGRLGGYHPPAARHDRARRLA